MEHLRLELMAKWKKYAIFIDILIFRVNMNIQKKMDKVESIDYLFLLQNF